MAISAVQTGTFKAFALVPTKVSIVKFCFRALKNNSTSIGATKALLAHSRQFPLTVTASQHAPVWPPTPPRTDGREHHPDAAAQRLAGDDGLVDPDGVEEQTEVVRVLLRRVIAVGLAAVPVSALVERPDVGTASRARSPSPCHICR